MFSRTGLRTYVHIYILIRIPISLIQFSPGIASMVGGWLGGVLGDYAAAHNNSRTIRATTASGNTASSQGRIVVALVSVLLGKPLYGLYLFETQFDRALFYMTVFQLVATWAPPGRFFWGCILVFFSFSGLVGYLFRFFISTRIILKYQPQYDLSVPS